MEEPRSSQLVVRGSPHVKLVVRGSPSLKPVVRVGQQDGRAAVGWRDSYCARSLGASSAEAVGGAGRGVRVWRGAAGGEGSGNLMPKRPHSTASDLAVGIPSFIGSKDS